MQGTVGSNRAYHAFGALPLQTLAMIGTGAGAAIALIVGGDLAAYVVAAGLLGHVRRPGFSDHYEGQSAAV